MSKNYWFNRYFNLKFVLFIIWEIRNIKKWYSFISKNDMLSSSLMQYNFNNKIENNNKI